LRALDTFEQTPTLGVKEIRRAAGTLDDGRGHEGLTWNGEITDARREVHDRAIVVATAHEGLTAREPAARPHQGVVSELLEGQELPDPIEIP
jgi:hypothetical protein